MAHLASGSCYSQEGVPQHHLHVLQVPRVPVHDVHTADVELVPVCGLLECLGSSAGWFYQYLQSEAQPEGY